VIFSRAVLLSHICSLGMTLDEVSLLLLVCNTSSMALILYLSFQGIPYAGGYNHTMDTEGSACSWPIYGQVFAVLALHKASLSSV
jgi:hypothetical protein